MEQFPVIFFFLLEIASNRTWSLLTIVFHETTPLYCIFFCDVVLYRIVLDAGYFLDNRSFFENFLTITLYAVIVSTMLTKSSLLLDGVLFIGNSVECICYR